MSLAEKLTEQAKKNTNISVYMYPVHTMCIDMVKLVTISNN